MTIWPCLQPYHQTISTFVIPTGGEKSTHTMWHAFHQGPHPSWANCIPRLEDSIQQVWHSGIAVIQVSDPDPHLVPNLLNGVHACTPKWPVLDPHILLYQKSSSVTCGVRRGFVLIHKFHPKSPVAQGSILSWRILMFHPAPPVDSTHHGGLHPIP